jgi:peptide/nickel transport system ATP-binding protein
MRWTQRLDDAAMTNGAAPLLSVRDLRVQFRLEDGERLEAVKGISFDVGANQTVALVGESGSGKSVTAMAILRLLPPQNSEIVAGSRIDFAGRNLLDIPLSELRHMRGRDIAMIFQEPMSSLNPVYSVGRQITETLLLHTSLSRAQAQDRAIALLTEVGMPEPGRRFHSFPHELSGGQQQRVMIAIAIACEPKLLIADEPTTALDVTVQKQILALLTEIQQRRGMSILFITHDLGVVGEFADRVVVMRHGQVREAGTTTEVFRNPQDAYTKALLNCRPRMGRRPKRLPTIEDFTRAGPFDEGPHRDRGYGPHDDMILSVGGLSKHFPTRDGLFKTRVFKAVDDVSFQLARGKTLGVVGESGSGKTTVGLTLMRLHEATAGYAKFDGVDLLKLSTRDFRAYKRRIQIIFQNPYASLNPRFTVGQVLTEPMLLHNIGQSPTQRRQMAQDLLERVGLPASSYHKYPYQFSGGQRQRIAIARCLTMKPDILICDEAVSALDVSVQAQVLNLLQDLQDDFGMSYIFISHDLSVIKHMSDQVMVMQNGKVVEQNSSDAIYSAPQTDYTRRLLSAIPTGLVEPRHVAKA